MSTQGRFLLSIAAVLTMLIVTSVPASGQVGSRATRLATVGWTVRFADRPGGGAQSPAGPVPRTPDGKPDLTGQWNGSGGALTHTVILEAHAGGFGIQGGKYEDPVGHCEFYDIGRIHSFAQEIVYKVFTRPWTMTSAAPMTRERAPRGDFDGENTCHEGNVDLVHLKNVYD